VPAPVAAKVLAGLESGAILFLQDVHFDALAKERVLFSPTSLTAATAKNISYDPGSDRVAGSALAGDQAAILRELLRRFSDSSGELVGALFPHYRPWIARARASFRPAEVAGRATSWRHDDTRLHIDSFPATPVQGRRILRVFTNVNPDQRSRSWRVGEPFEQVAERFGPMLRTPLPFSAALLRLARITKSLRSPYDALMLQLHDRMKADLRYQVEAPQAAIDFPAGSTWIAFTDHVSHAAMAGQYQLEQTFLVPVGAMREPERSPLRILERIKRRPLA